jgi:hypothetical protein
MTLLVGISTNSLAIERGALACFNSESCSPEGPYESNGNSKNSRLMIQKCVQRSSLKCVLAKLCFNSTDKKKRDLEGETSLQTFFKKKL